MEPNVASTDDMPRAGTATIAGIAALLARYTDRSELVIGYRHGDGEAQRDLRLDVTGDPTFSALLGQVQSAIDGHAVEREDEPREGEAAGQDDEAAHLDAVVGPGPALLVRQNGSLREPTESEPLRGHLQRLLDAAEADPQQPIGALPILTEAERERLLYEWNQTAEDYPRSCLHELISRQAASTPDAIAVQYEDERISYAELDARANQLAHHLQGLGVGPEVLVGICVERSAAHGAGRARDPQSRRRLRADRSGLSGRSPGVHARELAGSGDPHGGAAARLAAAQRRAGALHRRRMGGDLAPSRRCRRRPERSRAGWPT